MTEAIQKKELSNLHKRIISAVILAPLVLYIVYIGGISYRILISVAALIMFWEWQRMIVTLKEWRPWGIAGLFYIGLPCAALIAIREMPNVGLNMILYILFVVWATDIGAYFAGRTIGGPKIWPAISPKKTWAGLFGGMLAAFITAYVFMYYTNGSAPLVHAFLAIAFAVISQAGDFFESFVKRKCGVKDSSNIIPGHGGLLDRLDGLMFAAPAAWVMLQFVPAVNQVTN